MELHSLTVRGIPASVLRALRAAAKQNRRSLNAEVLVRLEAGAVGTDAPHGKAYAQRTESRRAVTVREPERPPYEVRQAFEEANLSRLRSDLALTPEQRVHLGEELARVAAAARPRPRFRRVIQFDTYEDYLDWQRFGERDL